MASEGGSGRHQGEVPFMECDVCEGSRKRERKSPGSMICKHNKCAKLYRIKLQARRAGSPTHAAAAKEDDAPTRCHKIHDVLGVSMCLPERMSASEKRGGRGRRDDDISIQVRANFAEHVKDPGVFTTKWVPLGDLVDELEDAELKKLETFLKDVKGKVNAAQKRLRTA